jgi:serine/threonine-protein kinase ATR
MRLDPELRISDSIRQKEATGDWEGALQDHEHSQQILGSNPTSRYGSLKCLLELGHFESVLNQVNGLVKAPNGQNASELGPELDMVCPFAIEAAWRLGRWETLDELVSWGSNSSKGSPDSRYQTSLGSIMLGIKRHDHLHIETELKEARSAVMVRLSSCARESYSRAYNLVVQLQCLREIEDSAELLCSSDVVDLESQSMDWFWNRRLEFLSSSGASTVIKARLALSRLAKDTALEGSLFLNLGKRARKGTLRNIAGSCFAQAETALLSISNEKTSALKRCTLHRQLAKLKHDCGESSAALSLLQLDNEEGLASESPAILQSTASRYVYSILQNLDEGILSESHIVDVYSRSLLQTTRWMIEGSLKDGAQIKDRFTILHRLSPRWEKGHFQYAKYIDSMLESRIEAIQRRTPERYHGLDEEKMRSQCLGDDKVCHQNILLAIQHYVEALKLDTKNVYHALPRLLSLWFDFTAIVIHEDGLTTKKPQGAADARVLSMAQEETNALIANEYKSIPPLAFYTAMPQLISRVTHTSNDTERIVRTILTRVLTKHPEQAMWPLGWLRQSQLKERREIGDALFQQAESTLLKLGGNNNLHRNKVLVESKSLFKHLHDIAVYKVSDMTVNKINVKPWKGVVQLCDFIPPIQAALSVSILSGGNSTFRESFPRHVPRMRSFSQQVGVMGSKARPKKLKAFIVSTDTCRSSATLSNSAERRSIDIGEIHFLVKQEAKGDLRKDARVQDFNNVVNRLIVSSTFEKGASQYSRRLRLRTYTVTCLSEDTGILEWVPNTDSLRSLIAKSYNPQASPFSAKRRGHRVANFGDPMLRTNFEKKCQPMFFENGNLRRAATMFDELCLKPYPPLLYWWFVQHFPDPHSWYEARTRFTLSAAVWSGVGHVIGLGDRHSENILVDTTCGECVHVDFDWYVF